jgi:hypothetical protein
VVLRATATDHHSMFLALWSIVLLVLTPAIAMLHGKSKVFESLRCDSTSDCGEEVCITYFLEEGNPEGARNAIQVLDLFPDNVESYAGFAMVNETAKNKLFFWYVPALNKNSTAPLLIWLNVSPLE